MSHFLPGGYQNFDPYYISEEEESKLIEREKEEEKDPWCDDCRAWQCHCSAAGENDVGI